MIEQKLKEKACLLSFIYDYVVGGIGWKKVLSELMAANIKCSIAVLSPTFW